MIAIRKRLKINDFFSQVCLQLLKPLLKSNLLNYCKTKVLSLKDVPLIRPVLFTFEIKNLLPAQSQLYPRPARNKARYNQNLFGPYQSLFDAV